MRISLQTKIWIAVASIVLIFSLFVFAFFPYQTSKNFEQYFHLEATRTAGSISNSLEIALLDQNFTTLEVVMKFVKTDTRVDFITIAQPDTIYNDKIYSNKHSIVEDSSSFRIDWNVFKTYPDTFPFSTHILNSGNYIFGTSGFETDIMSGLVIVGFNKTEIIRNRDKMITVSTIMSSCIFALGLFISFFISRSISSRVLILRNAAIKVGRGNLNQRINISVNDEIGELATAFNSMIGNLEKANISIRDKTIALESSYKIIEENNRNMTDSIRYAQRIQRAIIPTEAVVKKSFSDSFIVNLPKDIVSGDFYWVKEIEGHTLFCVADCTGHGVPGAFMSFICTALLDECSNTPKFRGTDQVFRDVRKKLIRGFQGDDVAVEDQQKEGMDAILIKWNKEFLLEFSAAYNPLVLLRKGELIEIKPDKQPVGFFLGKRTRFTKHQMELQKGDVVYLMSDGYQDQFGGKRGKKFKASRLKEMLVKNWEKPMDEQKDILTNTFNDWKGKNDQVDDVLIVGIRF